METPFNNIHKQLYYLLFSRIIPGRRKELREKHFWLEKCIYSQTHNFESVKLHPNVFHLCLDNRKPPQLSYFSSESFKSAHYMVWGLWKYSMVYRIKTSCFSSKATPPHPTPQTLALFWFSAKTQNNITERITTAATTTSNNHFYKIPGVNNIWNSAWVSQQLGHVVLLT